MGYIRKLPGVDGGFIESIGNLEIAYLTWGEPETSPVCRPVKDLAPNYRAFTKAIGAFKVDGSAWVVRQATFGNYHVPANLVAKFAPVKRRVPLDVFNYMFADAYIRALQVESENIINKLDNGETIC